jgi:hypothetical protein
MGLIGFVLVMYLLVTILGERGEFANARTVIRFITKLSGGQREFYLPERGYS